MAGIAMRRVFTFLQHEDGTTAVEYAVMLAMILLALIGGVSAFGLQNGGVFGGNNTKLGTAFNAGS